MADFEKEFRSWEFERENDFEIWKQRILEEALKQGTYGKAKNWLKKNMPELRDSYVKTTEDQFIVLIRSMYEDARVELYKKMDKAKIEED